MATRSYVLPWPPSVNHYYNTVLLKIRGKWVPRTLISSEGRKYKADALAVILKQHGVQLPMTGRLDVEIQVNEPNKIRRDLDNLLKAILDSLREAKAFKDDSQIDRLMIKRHGHRPVPGGQILVFVSQLPDDAPLLESL